MPLWFQKEWKEMPELERNYLLKFGYQCAIIHFLLFITYYFYCAILSLNLQCLNKDRIIAKSFLLEELKDESILYKCIKKLVKSYLQSIRVGMWISIPTVTNLVQIWRILGQLLTRRSIRIRNVYPAGCHRAVIATGLS